MKRTICYYTLFLLSVCAACNNLSIQESYKSLKDEIWERDSNYKFEINISKSGAYTMSTCVRHTTDYGNKDISCYLIISHPKLADRTEIFNIPIINEKGAWEGQGLGGLKTVIHPINHVFHFDTIGIYTVVIRHRMKEKQLGNVKNIGIKVTKSAHH